MGKNEKIFIVIPAYNESPVILDTIKEVKKAGYKDIVVVDDGSTDGTILAQKAGVYYIKHSINRGKGAATKTGFEAAKILGADAVVTIDGDGQHDTTEIKKLLEPLTVEKNDVVLGTRNFGSKEIPFLKKIYNFIGNMATWVFYGLWVTDSQSGFRAYSKKALNLIDTKTDRYEYDSEVIREIKKNKLKFKEVPIEVKYTEYSMGKASKQGFKNGVKTLLKMILSLK